MTFSIRTNSSITMPGLTMKSQRAEIEEKDVSEDLMKAMGKVVTLESFVPQYQNQAIIFTGDDMGSDKAMMVNASVYHHCDHGICIWHHNQQYDRERSRCDRNTPGIRLYAEANWSGII